MPVIPTFALAAIMVAGPASRMPLYPQPADRAGATAARARDRFASSSTVERLYLSAISTPASVFQIDAPTFAASPYVSPQEALKLEVVGYGEYQDGWNGLGSIGPSRSAISAALGVLDLLPGRLPLPRPMLSSDGELGLYWDLLNGYAEICFDADGSLTFFSRQNDGKESFAEGVDSLTLDALWYWSHIGPLEADLTAVS